MTHRATCEHSRPICAGCKALREKQKRSKYEEKQESKGLCKKCPLPRLPSFDMCEHHRDKHNEYARKSYLKTHPVVKRIFRCRECGNTGHNSATCPVNPDARGRM